jgi:hypothetical protein
VEQEYVAGNSVLDGAVHIHSLYTHIQPLYTPFLSLARSSIVKYKKVVRQHVGASTLGRTPEYLGSVDAY